MKKLMFVTMLFAGLMFTASAAQAQSYQRVFNYNTGAWMLVPAGSPIVSNPPGFSTPGYANGYVYNPNNPFNGVVPGNYRAPGINSTGNHGYMGPGSAYVPAAQPYVRTAPYQSTPQYAR